MSSKQVEDRIQVPPMTVELPVEVLQFSRAPNWHWSLAGSQLLSSISVCRTEAVMSWFARSDQCISLPIIVATGKGAKDIREIFQGAEHIAFVGKPYRAENLYGALRTLGIAVQEKT